MMWKTILVGSIFLLIVMDAFSQEQTTTSKPKKKTRFRILKMYGRRLRNNTAARAQSILVTDPPVSTTLKPHPSITPVSLLREPKRNRSASTTPNSKLRKKLTPATSSAAKQNGEDFLNLGQMDLANLDVEKILSAAGKVSGGDPNAPIVLRISAPNSETSLDKDFLTKLILEQLGPNTKYSIIPQTTVKVSSSSERVSPSIHRSTTTSKPRTNKISSQVQFRGGFKQGISPPRDDMNKAEPSFVQKHHQRAPQTLPKQQSQEINSFKDFSRIVPLGESINNPPSKSNQTRIYPATKLEHPKSNLQFKLPKQVHMYDLQFKKTVSTVNNKQVTTVPTTQVNQRNPVVGNHKPPHIQVDNYRVTPAPISTYPAYSTDPKSEKAPIHSEQGVTTFKGLQYGAIASDKFQRLIHSTTPSTPAKYSALNQYMTAPQSFIPFAGQHTTTTRFRFPLEESSEIKQPVGSSSFSRKPKFSSSFVRGFAYDDDQPSTTPVMTTARQNSNNRFNLPIQPFNNNQWKPLTTRHPPRFPSAFTNLHSTPHQLSYSQINHKPVEVDPINPSTPSYSISEYQEDFPASVFNNFRAHQPSNSRNLIQNDHKKDIYVHFKRPERKPKMQRDDFIFTNPTPPRPFETFKPSQAASSENRFVDQEYASSSSEVSHYRQPPRYQYSTPKEQPVTKTVYVNIPPEKPKPTPPPKPRRIVLPQKHIKIIFVKAPTAPPPEEPEIEVTPPPETKTIIYVLHKKPEPPKKIIIPTPPPTKPSPPKVYFIQYKNEQDKHNKIKAASDVSNYFKYSDHVSFNGYKPGKSIKPTQKWFPVVPKSKPSWS